MNEQFLLWLQQQYGQQNPNRQFNIPVALPQNNVMQGYTQNMWNNPPTSTNTPQQVTSSPQYNFRPIDSLNPTSEPNIGSYVNPRSYDSTAMQGNQITQYVVPDAVPLDTNTTQQNGNNIAAFSNSLNYAFAPVSTENAVFRLGQSLAFNNNNPYASDKVKGLNTARGVASGAKTLASLLRTGFAGAAYQSKTNDAITQFYNKAGQQDFAPSYEDGGQHLTQEQLLTGSYTGDMQRGIPNAVVEKNEFIQTPQGHVSQVVGKTHEQGGVPVEMQSGSRVISDNLKIGGKTARELRKEYDIEVKANNTFAEVVDKYKRKIGLQKIDKEQEQLFKKLETNSGTEDESTATLNEQYLAEQIKNTEAAKQPLQQQLSSFTDLVFQKQEQLKGNTVELQFENGGTYTGNQLKDLMKKHNLTEEQGMEIISNLKSYADGGEYPFFNPSRYANSQGYGNQPFVPGMTMASGNLGSAEGVLERLRYQNEVLPYIVQQSGIYSANDPNNISLANTAAFQQSYDNYVQATIAEIDSNPYLTAEEKAAAKATAQQQALGISKRTGKYDNIYGEETSSRTNFVLPYLKQEDRQKYSNLRFLGDAVDEKGNIKPEYSGLDNATKQLIQDTYKRQGAKALNIGLGEIRTTEPQTAEAEVTQQQYQPINLGNQQARGFAGLNLVDQTVLPPSGLQPARMPDAEYRNFEAVQMGYEPQLQNLYTQESAAVDSLSGLAPAQRAAALAQISANTQQAGNQIIGQVNSANQQEMARIGNMNTQLFNQNSLLTNDQRELYERKMFAGLDATEQGLREYYNYNNRLNAMNTYQNNQAATLAGLFGNVTLDANGQVVNNGINPQLFYNQNSIPLTSTTQDSKKKTKK